MMRLPDESDAAFQAELASRIEAIRAQGILRKLRRIDSPCSSHLELNGRKYLNLSSNDYLGLTNEPAVKQAAIRAVERFGAGSGASRLICGSLSIHHQLEEELARFKKTEAALSFSSGYNAAVGTICAIANKDDVVILDKLVHASIVDGARLSGAKLRVFRHNDPADLERILKQETTKHGGAARSTSRKLIITESVFSMDGDRAPLKQLVELKEKYGAWLMLDEAHSTGLIGPNRRGLAELENVSQHIEIQMGTLGKALGSAGGFICGSRALVDYLINRARSFIFSTAPVPAASAAATAAIRIVESPDGKARCEKLWKNITALCAKLRMKSAESAIVPIIIGEEDLAVKSAEKLLDRGIFIPAIRYPAVARGAARLRLTVSAAHSLADVGAIAGALRQIHLSAA